MTEQETTQQVDTTFSSHNPALKFNTDMDLGNLLFSDVQSFADVTPQEFAKKTSENICTVYRALFDLANKQKAKRGGEDHEILEHDLPEWHVVMPKATTTLPREKPVPKEEVKTKWEKFREERGLPPRKKRSRLVYDPVEKDWVPRWGKGSIKHRAEGDQWLMHEKPKHRESGLNPFEYAKAEKRQKLEKQKLAELKNKINKTAPSGGKTLKILDNSKKDSMKLREEGERNQLRKREHKSLMKSLTLAQKSTASMGQFDKRLRNEAEPPKKQRPEKMKERRNIAELTQSRGAEKDRNLKVLDFMQRKREQELGGKVNGNMVGAQQKLAMTKKAGLGKKRRTGKKN